MRNDGYPKPKTAEDIARIVDAYLERIPAEGCTYVQIRDMRIMNPRFFSAFFFANVAPHLRQCLVTTSYGHYWRYKTYNGARLAEVAIPF